ncbi:VWA domain-containing protein [Xenorhabdus bovienii]|uniref:VWA domain-containing protein n=1 Tax=Xenorhabdus bovienii TaxID=40576 RepID=UPI003DA27FD4
MIRITRTVAHERAQSEYLLRHYDALHSALVQHLPINFSTLFAKPVKSSDGAIEWYSDLQGQPVPFAQLSAIERDKLQAQIARQLTVLARLREQLSEKEGVDSELLTLLGKISQFPAEEHIWSVDSQPVILWEPMSASASQNIAGSGTASPDLVASQPEQKRKPRWLWWLLLLLFILLLLWLLRGCLPRSHTHIAIKQPNPPVAVKPPQVKPVEQPIKQPIEQPAPTVPEVKPEAVVIPPPVDVRKRCPSQRKRNQAPEVVVVFDASGSMSISVDVTPQELQYLLQRKAFEYIEREPSRITLAKKSAKKIIDKLPSDMNVSLVAAFDCRHVSASLPFSPMQRPALKRAIDRITPDGKTPLALALEKAGALVDGVNRDAIILLISDGDETCGGDPCAVARALKENKPRLQVNVVDIMSSGAGNCIASQTGGKVFTANDANQFNQVINQAMQDYIPENCNE